MDGEPLSGDESALNLLGGFDNYQYAMNVLIRERLDRIPSEKLANLDKRLNLFSKTSLKAVLEGENVIWIQSDLEKMISVLSILPNMPLVPSYYAVRKMTPDQQNYWLRKMFKGDIPEVPFKGQDKSCYFSSLAGYLLLEALKECDEIAKKKFNS